MASTVNLLEDGDVEKCQLEEVFDGYQDANKYCQALLRSVQLATKASIGLPAAGSSYDYYNCFKGFRHVMETESKCILGLMTSILLQQHGKGNFDGIALDDKMDLLVSTNDSILERVGTALDEASGVKAAEKEIVLTSLSTNNAITTSWNRKNKNSPTAAYKLLAARNIPRPQLKFKDKIDNSNSPFVPIIKEKPHSIKPLAILVEQGEAGEEFSHPYEVEIEHFEPSSEHLEPPEIQNFLPFEDTRYQYIDKVEELERLCLELQKVKEFAVDLEHHSYRTFQGITCLMQLSTRKRDYIIDTLALRSEMHILNEVFTNPKIIKVFHGADLDIQWLQRDFGIYVVGLFDTGQASRVLNFAHYSLAYLLKYYCKIEANKQFQLADWRIRPLPPEMVQYGREDTHYLLFMYDHMRKDLIDRGNEQKNLLLSVYQRSKLICLKRYRKYIFRPDSYLELYKKSKKVFNCRQLYVLKELYTWRDKVARIEDESIGYVLPNHMMLQIAEILPREQQGILACCNPIPPLVKQNLLELHTIIMKGRELSLVKMEKQDIQIQVSSIHRNLDLDNILHCPHDLVDQHEKELELPVMLGAEEEKDDTSAELPALATSDQRLPTLSALVFSSSEDEDDNDLMDLEKAAGISAILKNLMNPFQRYKLVKPFESTSAIETTEPEVDTNETRVERVHEHFRQLTGHNNENVDSKASVSCQEETSVLPELDSTVVNLVVTTDDSKHTLTISDDSEVQIVDIIPPRKQLSRKRKKKRNDGVVEVIDVDMEASPKKEPNDEIVEVAVVQTQQRCKIKTKKERNNASNEAPPIVEERPFQPFNYSEAGTSVTNEADKGKNCKKFRRRKKKRQYNPYQEFEVKGDGASTHKYSRRQRKWMHTGGRNAREMQHSWPTKAKSEDPTIKSTWKKNPV